MEKFREKLKLDIFTNILLTLALLAVFLYAILGNQGLVPFPTPAAGNRHWASTWQGFLSGCSAGIAGILIYFTVRNFRALGNEALLKKLFIQETDERTIKIWATAREAAYRTFLFAGLVAGLIAGFFSISVCVTIIACVFLASVIGLLYAIYYGIKF